jgi:carboxyl-terminal processing protease
MRKVTTTLIFQVLVTAGLGQTKFQKDFSFYWQTVNDNFAYFKKQKTNWDKVKVIYQPVVDTLQSENAFIHLLEAINNELYNGHVFLNRNTSSSNRPIPTGADLKVIFSNNKFIISEIRAGFNADRRGLKTGMIITGFNDIPVDKAVQKFLPRSVTTFDNPMYEYAVNTLLAGTHDTKRKITVLANGTERSFYPDTVPNRTESNYSSLLETKVISRDIGYIKINNSLGNIDLVKAFDAALDSLMNTKGLILDLRETPSGGITNVARSIMGRFINKELPYQKHIYTSEEKETGIRRSTLELVSPRLKIYSHPLIVLVGYWTGSMSEGIAIGFDGMKRAKIAGTKMAGLLGEIYSFETPEMKIPFSFPCVQLQHINGQPREDFKPAYIIKDQQQAIKFATDLLTAVKK